RRFGRTGRAETGTQGRRTRRRSGRGACGRGLSEGFAGQQEVVEPGVDSLLDGRYSCPGMSIDSDSAVPAPAADKPLDDKLAILPGRPGVYLLKDKHGKVIYVGKARSLRARVRTYFRGGDERSQVAFLMQRVNDFDSLVTATEKEA